MLCVVIPSTSVVFCPAAAARGKKPTAATRQQALVKQINQRARRFYKAFVSNSVRAACVDPDLNDLLEDLVLAVEGLTDPRYTRANLMVVLQIAADIEQEVLWPSLTPDIVIAWSRLHADLDRLAKMNGIKWGEVIITNELIAALVIDSCNTC